MISPPHERAVEEFWVHVAEHKGIVLGIIALFNLAGLFLYTQVAPVYESRIGIEVRRTFIDNRLRKIQSGEDVQRYLLAEFEHSEHNDGSIRVYKPIVIRQTKRDLVFIVVRGGDPETLTKLIGEPLQELRSRHRQVFTDGRKALEEVIEDVQYRLDRLGVLEEKLTDADPTLLPGHSQRAGAAEQDNAQMVANRAELERRLFRLREAADKIRPTRVFQSTNPANEPISPSLMMYLFLASIVGSAIGLTSAILLARRDRYGA